MLPAYLLERGFSALTIGFIITATLVGSALLTLWLGNVAHKYSRRLMLISACMVMAATGPIFAMTTNFWVLAFIGFIGTINPTSGDVSIFLPLEQAALTETATPRARTAYFAHYSLAGTLMGAIGALAGAIPDYAAKLTGAPQILCLQAMFWLYGGLALAALPLYGKLSPKIELRSAMPAEPLRRSRTIVYELSALFSLDAFGGGFFVQSLLALWLYQRFHLSITAAGAIFFWTSVASAASYLVSVPLSKRIGLINTMVFTHLPSNILIVLVPFAPSLSFAIALLIARSALSQMDVPTRNSYVMAVVAPTERAAAASLTAVPRSLAAALSPVMASYLLTLSAFGWPLIIGGVLKATYDLLLLAKFKDVRPPEET
jgi:MFS family permease